MSGMARAHGISRNGEERALSQTCEKENSARQALQGQRDAAAGSRDGRGAGCDVCGRFRDMADLATAVLTARNSMEYHKPSVPMHKTSMAKRR